MKKKIFIALTPMFFLFYFSLVFAQEKPINTPKAAFTAMDTNQDGRITKEEFMTFHMKFAKNMHDIRFNQLDTNRDGMISKDEFSASKVKEAQFVGNLQFRFIDINNDKAITEEEVQKRFNALKQMMKKLSE